MATHYIRIYYGPVDSFGLGAEHKPQFVYGLRDRLRKLGNRVDIQPVRFINMCVVECCGYIMFRCNIKSLCFNTSYHFDPVCKNAVDAVLIGTEKLQRARTYLWIWNLIDNQLFKRSEYSSKDYWIGDIPPMIEHKELDACAKCCSLLSAIDRVPSHEKFFRAIGEVYTVSKTQKEEWAFKNWFTEAPPDETEKKELTDEEQLLENRAKGIVRAPRITFVANRPPPIKEDQIRKHIEGLEVEEKPKAAVVFQPEAVFWP